MLQPLKAAVGEKDEKKTGDALAKLGIQKINMLNQYFEQAAEIEEIERDTTEDEKKPETT